MAEPLDPKSEPTLEPMSAPSFEPTSASSSEPTSASSSEPTSASSSEPTSASSSEPTSASAQHDERAGDALRELRLAVRSRVTPPPVALVRARGERRRRTRNGVVIALAAAAAAAFAVTGTVVVRAVAHHDRQAPAEPTSVPTAAPPSPDSSAPPTVDPSATMSVSPSVGAAAGLGAGIDWKNITLTLPARPLQEPCLTGTHRFSGGRARAGDKSVLLAPDEVAVYGDLTGDGRPEAVLRALCLYEQDSGDGTGQLLVITRRDDGALVALDWAGPAATDYSRVAVADRKLTATGRPRYGELYYLPRQTRSYTWNGSRLTQVGGPTRFYALRPGHRDATTGRINLPDIMDDDARAGRSPVCVRSHQPMGDDATMRDVFGLYRFGEKVYVELDQPGSELAAGNAEEMLIAITCEPAGKPARTSLYTVRLADWGLTVVGVPVANDGTFTLKSWKVDGRRLTVSLDKGGKLETRVLNWDGARFGPEIGGYR